MNYRKALYLCVLALLLVVFVGACSPMATPTATPVPPTATPVPPTPTPIPPSPTPVPPSPTPVPPSPTPRPTAMPTPSLRKVEFGALKAYSHKSKRFSIDAPEKWTIKDTSKPTEDIVTWTDPTGNALIYVDVFPYTQKTDTEKLGTLLKDVIASLFKDLKNLKPGEPKPQPDGSVGLTFTYDSSVGGGTFLMLGNSFIQHDQGAQLSILVIIVPDSQFNDLKTDINTVLNSFEATPPAPPTATPRPAPTNTPRPAPTPTPASQYNVPPGKAGLLIRNYVTSEITFNIKDKEYKIPKSPGGGVPGELLIILDPGKYTYSASIPAGGINGEVELTVNRIFVQGFR